MYRMSYISTDNEDGNPPRKGELLFNTEDPLLALAMALRELGWDKSNVAKNLRQEPKALQNYVTKGHTKGGFPAIEATDAEMNRSSYTQPHFTYEDISLEKTDGVPVSLPSVDTKASDSALARLVRRNAAKVLKEAESPTSQDVRTAAALGRLLAGRTPPAPMSPVDVDF
jgi:hypothetical protein